MEHRVFVQYVQCLDESNEYRPRSRVLVLSWIKPVGEIREGWIGQTAADQGFTKTEPSKK